MKTQNAAMNLIKFPKNINKDKIENLDLTVFINRRVEVTEHVGTVKYIGKLHHTKGGDEVWVGIEWDDPERGKHNGTVENFCYFKTLHETSGSLIKFNKVNLGLTFLEACKYKYNFEEQDEIYAFLNKNIENDLFIQANKKKINIEIVGKDKANKRFSEFDSIFHVDLAYSYICDLDDNLSQHFPKLKELNLQKTLFSKWSHFLQIFFNFPSLEILNFSENYLNNFFDEEFYSLKNKLLQDTTYQSLSLNYLIMNKCKLDFISLKEISFLMKNVQVLYLMGNELNEVVLDSNLKITYNLIDDVKESFSSLNTLSLEKNRIKNFLKVIRFFPSLKINKINLNQNLIARIYESEEDKQLIKQLNNRILSICLDFNPLKESIEILRELCLFNNLADLDILNNNSIIKMGVEYCKYELIGRLPKLSTLNNTSISKDERRDYELLYLKNSVANYFKTNLNTENFDLQKFENFMSLNDPQYFTLKKKYYDPLEDIVQNVKPQDLNTLKGNMLEITFQNDDKKITKKFPKTTSFANLRNLMSKLFKLSAFSFYINNEELISDESKSLDNYSLNSNHIIYLK
jgi:hypothetical protein